MIELDLVVRLWKMNGIVRRDESGLDLHRIFYLHKVRSRDRLQIYGN